MRQVDTIDKIVLFLTTSLLHATLLKQSIVVEPYIVVVIFIGLITYFDTQPNLVYVFGSLYALLCVLMPELSYFLPLIVYGMHRHQRYSWMLHGVIAVVCLWALPVLQALMMLVFSWVAILLKTRTLKQADVKQHLLRMSDEARELSLNLKRQNQALIEKQDKELHGATLDERNRIAREIHDTVGHQLSSALMQVGALMIKDSTNEGLKTLRDTLNHAMDNIRNSVHNLYDESIDLASQIDNCVKAFTFCKVQLTMHFDTTPTSKTKYAILAIIKEALSNVIKHSNASLVRVSFIEHPGFYQLIVSDNGTRKTFNYDQGIGLKNIAHRIEALNGYFLIRDEKGFEVFMTLPKEVTL